MSISIYLRPSLSGAWSRCAGYAALNSQVDAIPDDELDNEVREDGTACHWLAQELIAGNSHAIGDISPNGRELTPEMFDAVDEYRALLASWACVPVIEQPLPVSQHMPGIQDGTPDAWGLNGTTLHVGDLKYGFAPVEVWKNSQLTIYAYTLLKMLVTDGHVVRKIVFHICQPRCAHRDGTTRSWTTTPEELCALGQHLIERAWECYAAEPLCTVGPQCANCPASYACQSLQAAGLRAAEISYGATPMELTERQLGHELAVLMQAQKNMENRIVGLSAQAEHLLRRGKRVPGFELGRKATRWRWRNGADQMLRRLGEMFGVEVETAPTIKSVAKLRNSFPIDVQTMYAEKPEGELKLRMIDPHEAEKRFTTNHNQR